MAAGATVASLEKLADGLVYQSETDAPWEAFAWRSAEGDPSADGVRRQAKQKASAPVAEQSVDEFFAPLVKEQDWFGEDEKADAAKYCALLDGVKKQLKNPKVFRVGKRKQTVFVVGAAPEGGWAGLKTTAVET